MTIPDDILTAYVDGELDPVACAEVETALRTDTELAARAAKYRDLRARLESAYAPELTEPVPARLLTVLRERAPAAVTDLAAVRAARNMASSRRWTGARVTSMAAGVLLAVSAGLLVWRNSQSVMVRTSGTSLVASGALARSLSEQLAGEPDSSSQIVIGLSFLAKSGDYCRTFSIAQDTESSGLACRRSDRWRIEVLVQPATAGPGGGSIYRTASSSLAPEVLAAVRGQISGEPLDRAAEIRARGRKWVASR